MGGSEIWGDERERQGRGVSEVGEGNSIEYGMLACWRVECELFVSYLLFLQNRLSTIKLLAPFPQAFPS